MREKSCPYYFVLVEESNNLRVLIVGGWIILKTPQIKGVVATCECEKCPTLTVTAPCSMMGTALHSVSVSAFQQPLEESTNCVCYVRISYSKSFSLSFFTRTVHDI